MVRAGILICLACLLALTLPPRPAAKEEPLSMRVRPLVGIVPVELRITLIVRDDTIRAVGVAAFCEEMLVRSSEWTRAPGEARSTELGWYLGERCVYAIVARAQTGRGKVYSQSVLVEVR